MGGLAVLLTIALVAFGLSLLIGRQPIAIHH
jgi:hypothetical protein